MKKIIWSVSILLVMTGCNNTEEKVELNPSGEQTRSNLAAGTQSEEELREAAEQRRAELQKREEERMATLTTMEILPNEHDFGVIPKEVPVTKTFIIKNTGERPLVINDAKASCGCTVPKKPEEPILPGETGELEVTFTSNKGQEGQTISKTVTVTANILEGTQRLTIKGRVQS